MAAEQINEQKYHEVWTTPVIRMGMATMLIACVLSFIPLIYLYMVHGILPPFGPSLAAWGLVASVFGAFYIVEPISYYPILGLAGTYISFLSGNISNLRLPCSAMAQEVVGVQEGTKQAEIIGTMGIIGSVITNLIGVTLAAFVGSWLIGLFPAFVADAFRKFTAPAIFGAVFGQFAMRQPKLAPFALVIPLGLLYIKAPIWLVILAAVFGTIIISRVFYKMKIIH
ncbi:MAG: hypothetical protein EOM17_00845 [Synergistales bacterium]|nr:hypothetical protein [Synergistales bacterium]